MSYKILLFDLDDTLLDFAANEAVSLNKLFQLHGYTFTDEIFQTYNSVNKQLWKDYENGGIILEEVLNSRFSETMNKLGQTVDGMEWENQYRELLSNGFQLMDGAYEVCSTLSKSHRLFIITNGVTKTQIKRVKESGLSDFFEDIFISQSIGYQKPAKEFFDYVMNHIKDFNKEEALIIGDTINSDIKGGILSGIDTCLISRKPQEQSSGIQSTYTITKLSEIYDICSSKK